MLENDFCPSRIQEFCASKRRVGPIPIKNPTDHDKSQPKTLNGLRVWVVSPIMIALAVATWHQKDFQGQALDITQ